MQIDTKTPQKAPHIENLLNEPYRNEIHNLLTSAQKADRLTFIDLIRLSLIVNLL